jgi:hypothetical protein
VIRHARLDAVSWASAILFLAVLGFVETAHARGQLEAHAYVLLAPGASDGSGGPVQALARVIITAADHPCPALSPGALTMTARTNPNPKTFAVTVCEAVYPFDQALTVDGFGTTLPKVSSAQPTAIVVIGDSGCRGGSDQDCSTEWPFEALAKAAAAKNPDLVIHVGDYNYRGTPGKVDGKDVYDGCATDKYVTQNPADDPHSKSWDRWKHWRDDFFKPAAHLLAAAPWVFIRGNHELCSRAAPGYFYFLDPHSSLLGHDPARYQCPAQVNGGDPSPNLTFVPPYGLSFDAGLTLVVLDSANACDTANPVSSSPPNYVAIYAAQFGEVKNLIQTSYAWLATHRPIWGAHVKSPTLDCASKPDDCLNATMQEAISASPGGTLPQAVQLALSGHMHLFEALSFQTPARPPQLVVGDSGVELSGTTTSFMAENLDGGQATGVQLSRYGFMDLALSQDGKWVGLLVGEDKAVIAMCGSEQLAASETLCALTGQ